MEKMNKRKPLPFYATLIFICAIMTVLLTLNFRSENQIFDPMEKALRLYQKNDYENAIVYFAQADNRNIPEASFALGAMHFSGKGTEENISKALFYYEKAAESDYTPAMITLALLYAHGEKVDKDSEKAVQWAKKAAERNDAEAQSILAGWYENGIIVEQNIFEAVRYYEMAAKNGDANAKMALSLIYRNGKGNFPPNIYAAQRWEDSMKKQKKLNNLFRNRPADYIDKAIP